MTEENAQSCFFLNSPEIQSNLTKKVALGEKCLKVKSPKFVFGYGARAISVDDRKCGTKNATSIEMIEVSELCYSQANNKLSKYFFFFCHTTYIRNDMGQKYEGNCGLWVRNEIIIKNVLKV